MSINRLPVSFLSKLDTYEIEMHGEKVKVSVVDNPAMVSAKIYDLKSSLQTFLQRRVAEIDIKFVKSYGNSYMAKLLLLCCGARCLIIQLIKPLDLFPETLVQFLSDKTICFLGAGMRNIIDELNGRHFSLEDQKKYSKCQTGVEVGYMAAKFLKKANIERYGLVELGGEVGKDIKEPISECPNWDAVVFLDEEIMYAMHQAYAFYVIGKKLFDMH